MTLSVFITNSILTMLAVAGNDGTPFYSAANFVIYDVNNNMF